MKRSDRLQRLADDRYGRRLERARRMREQAPPRPGLLSRIRQFFAPSAALSTDPDVPDVPPPLAMGSTDPTRDAFRGSGLGDLGWGLQAMERARQDAYRDFDAMQNEMPEYCRALDVVAEDVTSNGRGDPVYKVVWKPGTDQRKINAARETERRLKLQAKIKPVCRKSQQGGDAFGELSPSADGQRLAAIYPRAAHTMFRVHDPHGRLVKFVQKAERGTEAAVTFLPGQIVHVRANHRWGDVYGTAMGASGRYLYRKLAMMDDAVVAMRLTRAIMRYAMVVDVGKINFDDWEEHFQRIEFLNAKETLIDENGRLDLRAKVMDDQEGIMVPASTPGVGSIQLLDGSRGIGRIEDIKLYLQRFITMLPPPPAFLGIEENVNSKATLQYEGVEYAKYVRSVQQSMEHFPKSVIRRDLARQGMATEEDDFEIVFPVPSVLDDQVAAEVLRLRAQAAEILGVNVGMPWDFVVRYVLDVSEDVADKLIAELETREPPTAPSPAPFAGPQEKRRMGREVFDVLNARNDLRLLSEALALMAEYKADGNGAIAG